MAKFHRKFMPRVAAVVAAVSGATLLVASPAMAHDEVSETKVSVGSAAQTIIGPTLNYNLSELGIGCTSTFKASFSPTWTVSKVTSSSVFIDTLTVSISPARKIRLGPTSMLDGNNREQWNGNWALPSTGSVKKTWFFRRTVSFGSHGYIDVNQLFGFEQGDVGAICGNDKIIDFWLRRG
jgi:hypothetical protein